MFVKLANPRQETSRSKGFIFMATQSKSKTNGTTPSTKASTSQKKQARTVAESAVDLPVGAVLVATDRISELVEPFTGRSAAEKQLKTYRTQLRRQVKRTERRGATARRRATTEVRKTQKRVEQRVRKAAELLPV